MHPEQQYIDLLRTVILNGEERKGRNGTTYSIFGHQLSFDIQANGFPLLTTKRVFWRGIVEELLWFLRGHTDSKLLEAKQIHIWKGNTTRDFLDQQGLQDIPEGSIGEGYSWQWRHFNAIYPDPTGGTDQLAHLIKELKFNPMGRRALLVAWNPARTHRMALPPCHYAYQFHVTTKNTLDCMMTMRSNDICCGQPYNIASTALFTTIMAWALHMTPGRIILNTGDTHIYEQHLEAAQEQMSREPFRFPTVTITATPPEKNSSVEEIIRAIEALTIDDIALNNYTSHPPLKMIMVV